MRWIHRTKPPAGSDRKPGWRVLVPTFPAWRRGYNATWDEFTTGWWWFSVGFSAEPLVIGTTPVLIGVCVRVTWGWVTLSRPVNLPKAKVA